MIQIGDTMIDLGEPRVQLVLAATLVALIILILLIVTVRRAGRATDMMAPMLRDLGHLGQRVEALSDGQNQLSGGLTQVSEAQATSQANMLKLMEQRLADVTNRMNENLQGTSTRTARS
ncbi:MAG: DNA recombination protein RmuC, partial [Silicimonas sp.]|nr:DNA recombination protein RmuC [Silicimonas sp.]